ncbi:hypothetical protein CLAIMM_11495 [Cladophialophora immunda]|nr:hypothetical protein CLAIMM_11495 [Cladophialophora immunda]
MLTLSRLVAVLAAFVLWPLLSTGAANVSDLAWYEAEVRLLADLKARVTGTPSQNQLIDHIQSELELLGLTVYNNTYNFTYLDQPLSPPSLSVAGKPVEISSYAPYGGFTNESGVSGSLVDLTGHSIHPDWSKAAGKIAVLNITNSALNWSQTLAVWPGQPEWYVSTGEPYLTADQKVANVSDAAKAGVKGVIYVWEHMTVGNARGQYVPFKRLFQGMPTVFVAGDAGQTVLQAAKDGAAATLTLTGQLIPNTQTRTIWTLVEGTKFKNESVIINTHTDGINAVEENGHITLLKKAQDLVVNPPERTTILLFITGHMHQPAFSPVGRATTRWLDDNPQFWRGDKGGLKAVASSCVEHLGAIDWVEDLATGRYYSQGNQTNELLYANTVEVKNITQRLWNGAVPGFVRINDPIPKGVQSGEGEPFTVVKIPNMSMITSPLYLLAAWPDDFDESELVDLNAMKRQTESFLKIFDVMDKQPVASFGVVPAMHVPG